MVNRELYHFGVKGMKWGVRRYQDKNGKLTDAGKKRYSELINDDGTYTKKAIKENFERKVEKGVESYILGRKIRDPIVLEIIRRNQADIDEQVRMLQEQQLHDQMIQQQAIRGAEFAAQEATRASNQAASLGISGGTNPFLFG